MADLLRQPLIGDGWAWTVATAGRLELPAFAATARRGGPVGEVVRLPAGTVTLQAAVDAFLDHQDLARSTRRVCGASLASLVAEFGPATAVGKLSGARLAAWFRGRNARAAPATWNRELATLRTAVGWWGRRGWLAVDPTGDLMRRREQVDRTRALTRGQLEWLFARRDLALRERTLWRLLYETAARANELLALDGGSELCQPPGAGS
jgi:site-specific recombinase XerD